MRMVLAPCPQPTSATFAADFKFLDDTVEGRQPTRYEIGVIPPHERIAPFHERGTRWCSPHSMPLPVLKFSSVRFEGMESGLDNVVCARYIHRPVGICEAERPVRDSATGCFHFRGIGLHISAGALVAEPLTNVAFVGTRLYTTCVEVKGPFASSLYKPSLSPTRTRVALIAAPRSPTALPRKALSFDSSMDTSDPPKSCVFNCSGGLTLWERAYSRKISHANSRIAASQ